MGFQLGCTVVIVAATLLFWGAIAFVAFHFITKFW